MARFDLTFKGTVLPDHDPQTVKQAFAELFTIKDPFVLDQMFSGDTFVVRSNLDRKTAADYFRKVVELGGQAELVASGVVDEGGVENGNGHAGENAATGHAIGGSRNGEILVQRGDHIDQSWPVRSAARNGKLAKENESPEALERAAEKERLRSELTELRLARDSAEAAAADNLARLQQEQLAAQKKFDEELNRVRVMREQATEKGKSRLLELEQKLEDTRQQYSEQIAQLEQEQGEKNEAVEKALEELLQSTGEAEKELASQAEKLESDRQEISARAEEAVAKLEQLIAETRRQAEADLAEIEELLQANREAREIQQETTDAQREELLHQSAEDSDLLKAQLEECHADRDKLLASLANEREDSEQKTHESVAQLEEMEVEVELRWSGELDQLLHQVRQTQRKLEDELEALSSKEANLRHELTSIQD